MNVNVISKEASERFVVVTWTNDVDRVRHTVRNAKSGASLGDFRFYEDALRRAQELAQRFEAKAGASLGML